MRSLSFYNLCGFYKTFPVCNCMQWKFGMWVSKSWTCPMLWLQSKWKVLAVTGGVTLVKQPPSSKLIFYLSCINELMLGIRMNGMLSWLPFVACGSLKRFLHNMKKTRIDFDCCFKENCFYSFTFRGGLESAYSVTPFHQ